MPNIFVKCRSVCTDTALLELEVKFVGIGKLQNAKKIALLLVLQKK